MLVPKSRAYNIKIKGSMNRKLQILTNFKFSKCFVNTLIAFYMFWLCGCMTAITFVIVKINLGTEFNVLYEINLKPLLEHRIIIPYGMCM